LVSFPSLFYLLAIVLFIVVTQLIGIGVLGEYVGRIDLEAK